MRIFFQNIATRLNSPSIPGWTILAIAVIFLATDLSHRSWIRTQPGRRGVIEHDIKHYYSYLTAGLIEGDLRMAFMDDPEFENNQRFWNTRTEDGKVLIITSMGLAFLYAPFFLIAHLISFIFNLPSDGYASHYQFFLIMAGLFYALAGLVILKNILLRYFSPLVTAITLVLITIGTNLYYYSTFEAAMPHVYNFFLVSLFLWMSIRWYEKPSWHNAFFTGGLLGLITLVRPTNILVVFILLLWDVKSGNELWQRIRYFLERYYYVLLMILGFLLVWTPQMLYWRMVTGKFLYFSYGVAGASFYFGHPQIIGNLFSFIKGWYLYTPIMFVATVGVILLYKRLKFSFIPVAILLITMIYVQSSWWSWWFGGGFGLRAYIDIYAIMAIPLAAIIDYLFKYRIKWTRYAVVAVLTFLLFLSFFQTVQYSKGVIHYCGMSKESYKLTFLKMKPHSRYWSSLRLPDHTLAREGIYYFYSYKEILEADEYVEREDVLQKLDRDLAANKSFERQVSRFAKRNNLKRSEAVSEIVDRIVYQKNRMIDDTR